MLGTIVRSYVVKGRARLRDQILDILPRRDVPRRLVATLEAVDEMQASGLAHRG